MSRFRKCVICSKEYLYCPNCGDEAKPRWMFLFDSENCNNIWEEFNAYRTGAKDATQTLKALQKLDLSDEEKFDPVWKGLLNEIRAKAMPEEKKEEKNEQPKKFNQNFNKKNK